MRRPPLLRPRSACCGHRDYPQECDAQPSTVGFASVPVYTPPIVTPKRPLLATASLRQDDEQIGEAQAGEPLVSCQHTWLPRRSPIVG
jgi:hypothetical protein